MPHCALDREGCPPLPFCNASNQCHTACSPNSARASARELPAGALTGDSGVPCERKMHSHAPSILHLDPTHPWSQPSRPASLLAGRSQGTLRLAVPLRSSVQAGCFAQSCTRRHQLAPGAWRSNARHAMRVLQSDLTPSSVPCSMVSMLW